MTRAGANLTLTTSRALVLDFVRSAGPVSRVELAALTGLTPATMTNVMRQLLTDGLVIEVGRDLSTGGKPRVLLDINPTARFAVGIQLGADSLTYVVTNLGGAIVGRLRTRGAEDSPPAEVVARMARSANQLIEDLGIDGAAVIGVGLAAPGSMDIDRGVLLAPPTLRQWSEYPLRDALAEATGRPVLLDNDGTASAVGEFWGGDVPDASTVCAVYMGAGIGAGILLGGTVFRGASSNVGELGQMWLTSPRSGAAADTLERVAGPAGVAAAVQRALDDGAESSLVLGGTDPIADFTLISTAALLGDPVAVTAITHSAQDLAEAVLIAANLFDLDCVVLAGPSVAIAGSIYVEILQKRLSEGFFAKSRHGIEVRLSTHATDAAAVGAAALVLQHQLAPRSFGS
jgi:predicted NBD/HSP70 family sugar kinase